LVLTGRLIDRLGKGVRASPRDALIADAAGPEMRGRAFGFHRAMDTAGAVLGVLLSAALLWWFAGTPRGDGAHAFQGADAGRAFRLVFAIAAALGLVSLVITFMAKEPARPALAPQAGERSPHRSSNRPSFSGSYWRTLALLLVFSLANSSDTFLLLRARDVGLSPWSVVLAYALCNIVYAAASYPAGIVSDRLGRWRVIAVGWLIYAAVYAGMAVTGPVGVWPLLALYGVYMALTDGVSKALIADHAPPQARGTALGIFHATSGIFALAASLIAGLLWTRVAPPAAFWFAAAAALTAVALVPVLRTRAPSPAPPR
jgi:MFS family permease